MLPLVIALIRAIGRARRSIGHKMAVLADAFLEALRLSRDARRKYPYIE